MKKLILILCVAFMTSCATHVQTTKSEFRDRKEANLKMQAHQQSNKPHGYKANKKLWPKQGMFHW